ncbi:hypothetical protein AB1E18_019635 [Capra hircus]
MRTEAGRGRWRPRGRGPAPGLSCKRPRARRSAPLPGHSGWKARHWKPSASYVAVSRVGQQKNRLDDPGVAFSCYKQVGSQKACKI